MVKPPRGAGKPGVAVEGKQRGGPRRAGGRGLLTHIDQLAHLFSSSCRASSSCSWRDGVAGSVFHFFSYVKTLEKR
jgi:hypothetical protein